jgi:hypothetical protein
MSSPLYIHGYGSVSAAGLDSEALYDACIHEKSVNSDVIERSVGEQMISYQVRPVDAVGLRKLVPKHPRLRRSSPISKFSIAAACQALGKDRIAKIQQGEFRLGIVVSFFNGCIGYSNRFYKEVLDDPKFASPILFPETVFNAPASHVASYLGSDGPVYTLIGDSAAWFSAVKVAQGWLQADQVDGCLVLCGEELDWLSTEGIRLYSRNLEATEGAAAVYFENKPSDIQLDFLSQPYGYTSPDERKVAIDEAWSSCEVLAASEKKSTLLVDGLTRQSSFDRDEQAVLQSWNGTRVSPLSTLGYGMGASCGFQTIMALEALKRDYQSAIVLAAGSNQHAFCAKFRRG